MIVGITTGGAIIGRIVSQLYDLPCSIIYISRARLFRKINIRRKPKKILLIDDLGDRGLTLDLAEKRLWKRFPRVKIITINLYPSRLVFKEPNHYMKMVDNVRFEMPWKNKQVLKTKLAPYAQQMKIGPILKLFASIQALKQRSADHRIFLYKIPFNNDIITRLRTIKNPRHEILFGFHFKKRKGLRFYNLLRRALNNQTTILQMNDQFVIDYDEPDRFTIEIKKVGSDWLEGTVILDYCSGRQIRCGDCRYSNSKANLVCKACSSYIRSIQKTYRILDRVITTGVDSYYYLIIGGQRIPIPIHQVRKNIEQFKARRR